jgi:phosphotransferase system enzyme I (PtsP)
MNAGLLMDMPHHRRIRGAGRGACSAPSCSSWWPPAFRGWGNQQGFYTKVLAAAAGRPVTFRSLDIGGDKVLPYFRAQKEENPAMGWRAIRLGLDRPALLRTQARALLKAAAGGELRLMFPW